MADANELKEALTEEKPRRNSKPAPAPAPIPTVYYAMAIVTKDLKLGAQRIHLVAGRPWQGDYQTYLYLRRAKFIQ